MTIGKAVWTLSTCPVCGSENVRRSRKKTFFGFISRWRGLQRYRCRDCNKSFYRPLSPNERAASDGLEGPQRRSRSERNAARKRKRRRKVELLLFFGMLAIFYAALKVLTHAS